jgi:hypothetical protein
MAGNLFSVSPGAVAPVGAVTAHPRGARGSGLADRLRRAHASISRRPDDRGPSLGIPQGLWHSRLLRVAVVSSDVMQLFRPYVSRRYRQMLWC